MVPLATGVAMAVVLDIVVAEATWDLLVVAMVTDPCTPHMAPQLCMVDPRHPLVGGVLDMVRHLAPHMVEGDPPMAMDPHHPLVVTMDDIKNHALLEL